MYILWSNKMNNVAHIFCLGYLFYLFIVFLLAALFEKQVHFAHYVATSSTDVFPPMRMRANQSTSLPFCLMLPRSAESRWWWNEIKQRTGPARQEMARHRCDFIHAMLTSNPLWHLVDARSVVLTAQGGRRWEEREREREPGASSEASSGASATAG